MGETASLRDPVPPFPLSEEKTFSLGKNGKDMIAVGDLANWYPPFLLFFFFFLFPLRRRGGGRGSEIREAAARKRTSLPFLSPPLFPSSGEGGP